MGKNDVKIKIRYLLVFCVRPGLTYLTLFAERGDDMFSFFPEVTRFHGFTYQRDGKLHCV